VANAILAASLIARVMGSGVLIRHLARCRDQFSEQLLDASICIAGALSKGEYQAGLAAAGFTGV
jgi:hypothetical protein